VGCLGFRRSLRLCLHRLTGFEQPALCRVQQVIGRALLGLNAGDRFTRLFVPRVLRAKLILGGSALVRDLVLLPLNALDGVRAVCQGAGR